MTIDINKLRRLAQAATPGPWYVTGKLTRYVEARIDGGLIQEVAACGPTKADGGYGPQQEANARLIAAANPATISELLDRLEAAEKERDALREGLKRMCMDEDAEAKEARRLKARIEQMEKQEPVAYLYEYVSPMDGKTPVWLAGRGEWNGQQAKTAKPLYALPGAQDLNLSDPAVQKRLAAQWGYVPATSVPNEWLPVPEKHPTFDPVDLQLSDGSVLCGCVPQSDGDYWWEGPSGEVFIDPKYANVTHWRLAAAPETKP